LDGFSPSNSAWECALVVAQDGRKHLQKLQERNSGHSVRHFTAVRLADWPTTLCLPQLRPIAEITSQLPVMPRKYEFRAVTSCQQRAAVTHTGQRRLYLFHTF